MSTAVVLINGEWTGGGFFMHRDTVVTAHHCIRDLRARDELTVQTDDEQVLAADVLQTRPEKDMAVLKVHLAPGDAVTRASTPARPYPGAEWRSPHRHPESSITLSGEVQEINPRFRCEAGELISALQLLVSPGRANFSGFSGGSVELRRPSSNPIGMIIEQRRERGGISMTETLFAADINEILTSFSELDQITAIDALFEDSLDAIGKDVQRVLTARMESHQEIDVSMMSQLEAKLLRSFENWRNELGGGSA